MAISSQQNLQLAAGEMFTVLSGGYRPPPIYAANMQFLPGVPPFTINVIDAMRHDYQVKLAMSMKTVPIMKPQFALAGDPEIVKFVEEQIRKIWTGYITDITDSMWYTRFGAEVLYSRDPKTGYAKFEKLMPFHPRDFRILTRDREAIGIRIVSSWGSFVTDLDGAPNMRSSSDSAGFDMFTPKCMVHIHNQKFGSFEGISEFEGSYEPWLEKVREGGAISSRSLWFYKSAFDSGIILHPPGVWVDPNTGMQIPYRDLALKMLESARNGNAIALENVMGPDGKPAWQYIPGEVHSGGDVLLQYIDHLDHKIILGTGIPDDVIQQQAGGTGGYAGRTIPFIAFLESGTPTVRSIARSIKEQCLQPMVVMNFGEARGNDWEIIEAKVNVDQFLGGDGADAASGKGVAGDGDGDGVPNEGDLEKQQNAMRRAEGGGTGTAQQMSLSQQSGQNYDGRGNSRNLITQEFVEKLASENGVNLSDVNSKLIRRLGRNLTAPADVKITYEGRNRQNRMISLPDIIAREVAIEANRLSQIQMGQLNFNFDASEPRDESGKWTAGGGSKKTKTAVSPVTKPLNPAEAFEQKHGRKPTFQELHGGIGGLVEKMAKHDADNPIPSHSVKDVTPNGFGPQETDYDSSEDDEQLKSPDAVTINNLKSSINEAQTLLKGKLTPEKQSQIHRSLESTKKKLDDLMNHEPEESQSGIPSLQELHKAVQNMKQMGGKWYSELRSSTFDTKREAVAATITSERAINARVPGKQGEYSDYHSWDGDFRKIANEHELRNLFPPEEIEHVLKGPTTSLSKAIKKTNKKNEPEGGWGDEDRVPVSMQSYSGIVAKSKKNKTRQMSMSSDSVSGHWITIGGHGHSDDSSSHDSSHSHGGGTKVYIGSNGKILKGPAGLKGENVGHIGKSAPLPEKKQQQLDHEKKLHAAGRISKYVLHSSHQKEMAALNDARQDRNLSEAEKDRLIALTVSREHNHHEAAQESFRPEIVNHVKEIHKKARKAGESPEAPIDHASTREGIAARSAHAKAAGKTGRDYTEQEARSLGSRQHIEAHANAKQAAKAAGVSTHDVLQNMGEAHKFLMSQHGERESAKERARKLTGLNASNLAKIENTYRDYSSVPGFDTAARSVALEHKGIGLDPDDTDTPAKVWDLIREGKIEAPKLHDRAVADQAAEWIRDAKKKHNVKSDHDASENTSFDFGFGGGGSNSGNESDFGEGETSFTEFSQTHDESQSEPHWTTSQFSVNENGEHEFSSTQFNIEDGEYSRTQGSPESILKAMAAVIPDDALAESEGGREDTFHLTAKYGLHTNDGKDVENVVKGFGPVEVTFGKTSIFECKGFDVVKVEIDSPDLKRLNKLLSDSLEHTTTHPDYVPHCTLAYVKAGEGKRYAGIAAVDGMKMIFSDLVFSNKKREKTKIDLMPPTDWDKIAKLGNPVSMSHGESAIRFPSEAIRNSDLQLIRAAQLTGMHTMDLYIEAERSGINPDDHEALSNFFQGIAVAAKRHEKHDQQRRMSHDSVNSEVTA